MSQPEPDMDEPLTCAFVAESIGARQSLVLRLAQQGLIEVLSDQDNSSDEPLLTGHSIVQLRRMQRLRRDLGINFAGAAVILDLVDRIRALDAELSRLRKL